MDWKEKFWRALGAELVIGRYPNEWRIGNMVVAPWGMSRRGEDDAGYRWLDPSDPEVRLEVLVNGWQHVRDSEEYPMAEHEYPCEQWKHWYYLNGEQLRAALIAAICAVAGIEKEAAQ